MSFFYNFIAGSDLRLGILRFIFIVALLLNVYLTYHVNSYFIAMPVITRSQYRLLTSSTNESSKASNLLTTSSIESSEAASTSKNLSLESNNNFQQLLPSLQYDLLDPLPSNEGPSDSNHCLSTEIEFQNFNFQTVTTVGASSSISKFSNQFSHKFDPGKSVNMEANCKESAMDKKLPSEPVDLSQLIVSLSHQISSQMQSIQDQILHQNSVLQDQSV